MSYRKNWPTLLAYTLSGVVFMVVSGYAVLYGTGYRVNFGEMELIKTGVLAVSTKPNAAMITLNDKKLARPTPITLRNLLPGEYKLRLELAGYRSFEQTLVVKSGQVTEAHNLELVLEEVATEVVAEEIKSLTNTGGAPLYLSSGNELMRFENGESTPLRVDKLPEAIKNQLAGLTTLTFAKRGANSSWAIGGTIGNRKVLAIIDDGGYRGVFLPAPLNNVLAEQLMWVDGDRLLALVDGSLYKIDLTLNRNTVYAKDVVGAAYIDGRLVYVTRGATGQAILQRDNNPFDDRPGEVYLSDLPVGQKYELMSLNNKTVVVIENSRVKSLWVENRKLDTPNEAGFIKLATNISGLALDGSDQILYYSTANGLARFDLETYTEKELRQLAGAKLIQKIGESLLIDHGGQFNLADELGYNLYPVFSTAANTTFLSSDSRRVWIASEGQIHQLTLRAPGGGIFGTITSTLLSS